MRRRRRRRASSRALSEVIVSFRLASSELMVFLCTTLKDDSAVLPLIGRGVHIDVELARSRSSTRLSITYSTPHEPLAGSKGLGRSTSLNIIAYLLRRLSFFSTYLVIFSLGQVIMALIFVYLDEPRGRQSIC